ncbi:PREDICTED: uncharacterized protein LOC104709768 [Camelina sativa]|uniref:Uncharacterized protein LOC104709768 n=1 Tax=Camelina sativa TaxID=90675 RepID=A0ABM0TDA5_CAMSA|nr:PREDICTED: uncharacterized protein LOC104709768 [Camelina sativa]
MDDDDEEEDGPAIGKKPRQIKQPNLLNEPKREREARLKQEQDQAQGEPAEQELAQQGQGQPVGPASKIPPFGDGSRILRDYTPTGLFGDAIDQHEDTCCSVVITRLLQASYNKDRPLAEHRILSYRDLAEYIKGKNQNDKYAFRNLNIPIKYIRDVGLHRDNKISGPGVKGVKTKGDFEFKLDATKDFIYDKFATFPLGIVVEALPKLFTIKMGDIYHVPANASGIMEEHAFLVLAEGVTRSGLQFLVVQNSWGTSFANNGYFRITLPDDGKFKIFWPL